MADYVLIHGGNMSVETWNKLTTGARIDTPDGRMGGMIWDRITSALKEQNHCVFAPTLKDEYSSTLTTGTGKLSASPVLPQEHGELCRKDVFSPCAQDHGTVCTGTLYWTLHSLHPPPAERYGEE
jgi:hypothetical protein